MSDQKKPDSEKPDVVGLTLEERARIFEREILNAFTVKRQTGLADGAGAPGSTAAGTNRAGLADADRERGKRD
jgi:hypothetical protein